MGTFRNLAGERFGRLLVVDRAANVGRRTAWNCICDCGTQKVARSEILLAGDSQSCGCLQRELTSQRNRTHGHSRKGMRGTYDIWSQMIQRCGNPSNKQFEDYGARGIHVCDRWLNFESFLSDMGEKPAGLSIDRIDNDKGYEPGNCRWATRKEQNSNRRNVVFYELNGKKMHLKDWAKEYAMPYRTVLRRVHAYEWPLEAALTIPALSVGRRKGVPAMIAREMANSEMEAEVG